MYLGELVDGGTHDFYFTTADSTGAPVTLSGTPVISCYKDNNTTQTTTGITLTADFDSVTGLNQVRLVLTDAFYVAATDYALVITTGTVDGISVVGTVIANFSISNRYDEVNVTEISGDSTAADNLEAMYDGTGYTDETGPSSRAQVDGIGAAAGGTFNFEAQEDNTGAAIKGISFVGVQTNTFTNTEAEDGNYHIIDDTTNDIDIIYGFDVGGSRTATGVVLAGYLSGANDAMVIQAYDFVGADWETRISLPGQAGTSNVSLSIPLLSKHTGTGADLGKVYIRFEADGVMSNPQLNVDSLLVEAVSSQATIGYEGGAVWLDTNASNTNTESFVDGTADNPVSTLAAARTIADNLNLKVIHCLPSSSVTLTSASWDGFEFIGAAYTLALNSQSIDGLTVMNATVTGIGEATTTAPTFIDCSIGAVTMPPAKFVRCGVGNASGTFTAAIDAGDYIFEDCFSEVPGSGSPTFDFSPVNAATGINNRRWAGGATYTLDSNCTLSHEVLAGGGTTITTGGGDVELRGVFRALTVTMSAAETVQFVGITGPVTLSGTTTGTVNLYGVCSTLTDTTSAATVTNLTLSQANINAEVVDVISTDTYTLPGQTTPPLTPTFEQAVMWLYKVLRNRTTQTATQWSLYADNQTTIDAKSTVSDDGTTAIKQEIVSGP